MAGTDLGTGASLTFPDPTAFPIEITNISLSGFERVVIDAAHLGQSDNDVRTQLVGKLIGAGQIVLTCHFDPSDIDAGGIFAGTTGTAEITFPLGPGGTTAGSISFPAQCVGWEPGVPLEDKQEVTITLQVTGNETITDEV
jgi:hypothetical protein